MGTRTWVPVFLLLLSSVCGINGDSQGIILAKEKEVLDSVVNPAVYDYRVRPVENNDTFSPTKVWVEVLVRTISDVDEVKKEYGAQITLRQQWIDPRLKFDDMNGKLKYLTLLENKIWTPDLYISNEKSGYINNIMQPNKYLRIFPDGSVHSVAMLSLVVSCPFNVEFFPFDKQVCSFYMASYAYSSDDVEFLWMEGDPLQVVKGIVLNPYLIASFNYSYCDSKTGTGSYSCLSVEFHLTRDLSHYMLHLFFPSTMMVFITWIVFWLDIQATMTRLFVIFTSLLVEGYVFSDLKTGRVTCTGSLDVWMWGCFFFILAAMLEVLMVDYIVRQYQKRNCFTEETMLDTEDMENDFDLNPIEPDQDEEGLEKADEPEKAEGPYQATTPTKVNPHLPPKEDDKVNSFYDRMLSILPPGPKSLDFIARFLFPYGFAFFNAVYWTWNLF